MRRGLVAAALCLLALFAVLREQPLSWRNAGGWPVWLRDFVAVSFYPLLGLEVLLLLLFSSACLHGRGAPRPAAEGEADAERSTTARATAGGPAHPLAVPGAEQTGCVPIAGCPENDRCP